ncbi:MAG: hypothetical protein Q9174_001506 [Haloplaca sp. 1 TL-2023]
MRAALFQLFAILYLSYPVVWSRQLESRDDRTGGHYDIWECDGVGQGTGMEQLLPDIIASLDLVLADLERGTASRHGYRTFFKTNTNLASVKQVFGAMKAGYKVNGHYPEIRCLVQEGREKHDFYFDAMCRESRLGPALSAALPATVSVMVCPAFWNNPDFPNNDGCPAVSGRRGRRRFTDHGTGLSDTRLAVMIHELVHLYNPNDAGPEGEEEYSLQGCADLDASRSLSHASNYALYAAGE